MKYLNYLRVNGEIFFWFDDVGRKKYFPYIHVLERKNAYIWGCGTKGEFRRWAKENYPDYELVHVRFYHEAPREGGKGGSRGNRKSIGRKDYVKASKVDCW